MNKNQFAALFAAASFATSAMGEDLAAAQSQSAQWNEGRTHLALNLGDIVERFSETGKPDYQYNLGKQHLQKKDYGNAAVWLGKAAAQRHDDAKYYLARLYEQGKGVKKDIQKARTFYEELGAKSYALSDSNYKAQYRLGRMYEEGRGVKQDYEKAMALYREVERNIDYYDKNASKVKSEARYHIGRMYEDGRGVTKSYIQAISYYKDSRTEKAEQRIRALYVGNEMYKSGENYAAYLSPDEGAYAINSREKVLQWLEEDANKGNAIAQYNIGLLHQNQIDLDKALDWFEKAAINGNASAIGRVRKYYANQDITGVPVERIQAFYEKLAGKDNAALQIEAGDVFHRAGKSEKAIEWYGKVAGNKQNADHMVDAQYKIGLVYDDGLKNQTKALEWYKKAAGSKSASQSVAEAHFRIGIIHEDRKEYKQALVYYEKTVPKSRTGNSVFRIGRLYEDVTELQNFDKAWEWYRKAYNDHGHSTAAARMARIVDEGRGAFVPDYPLAKKLYEHAAAKGEPLALFGLGRMHEEGRGGPQNLPEAIKWYAQAADKNVSEAQLNLGRMYHLGKGFRAPDYHKARELYERAAAQGNAMAMNNLGVLFEEGKGGTEKNYRLARDWYSRAADRGVQAAKNNLMLLDDLMKAQGSSMSKGTVHASSGNSDSLDENSAVNVRWGKQVTKVYHRYFNDVTSRNTRYKEKHQSYEVAFESGDADSLGASVGAGASAGIGLTASTHMEASITKTWLNSAEAKRGHSITEGASVELDGTICDKWKLIAKETWQHGTASAPKMGINRALPFSMMVFHEMNAINLCDPRNKAHLPGPGS